MAEDRSANQLADEERVQLSERERDRLRMIEQSWFARFPRFQFSIYGWCADALRELARTLLTLQRVEGERNVLLELFDKAKAEAANAHTGAQCLPLAVAISTLIVERDRARSNVTATQMLLDSERDSRSAQERRHTEERAALRAQAAALRSYIVEYFETIGGDGLALLSRHGNATYSRERGIKHCELEDRRPRLLADTASVAGADAI